MLNEPSKPLAGSLWNESITRRRFLKRSGGATAATLIAFHMMGHRAEGAVSAQTAGSTEWEYSLRCNFDPTNQTDFTATVDGSAFKASKTETWDSGDNAITVRVEGGGATKGQVKDAFELWGKAYGNQDADADGGGEIVGEFSSDNSTGSYKEPGVNVQTSTLEIYMDGDTPKCRWTPALLSVPEDTLEAYDPFDDDDVLEKMKISASIIPAAKIGAAITAIEEGVDWSAGAAVSIAGKPGGNDQEGDISFSISRPSAEKNAYVSLTWNFEIVKRKKGSSDEWQLHGPISIDNQISVP